LIQGVMERARPEPEPSDEDGEDPDPKTEEQRGVVEEDAAQSTIDPVLMSTLQIQKYLLFGGQNG